MKSYLLDEGQGAFPWPPKNRGPLIPIDMRDNPRIVLPSQLVVPTTPSVSFHRGDHWGTPLPNLKNDYGNHGRCWDWFIPNYLRDQSSIFDDIVQAKYARGLTHILHSRGGAFGDVPPGEYAQVASRFAQAGFFNCHMLASKDTDQWNQPWTYYRDLVKPYLDALLAAGAIDKACAAWEANIWLNPKEYELYIDWLVEYLEPHGVVVANHNSTYVTAWYDDSDGSQRGDFYRKHRVKELWYQANQNDSLGMMQAHLGDALDPPSGIPQNDVRVCWFEVIGQNEFDDPKDWNEETGAMLGYGGMCSVFEGTGWTCQGGYGNGARMPDGSAL